MSNETLILTGGGYGISVTTEAQAQKDELLMHSALIVEVADPSSNEAARNQLKKLAAVRNQVEKSRKAVKEPVLAVGKTIDEVAKAFLAELGAEEKRIADLMQEYALMLEQARQKALREMEEKRRAEEKARQEAEAARLKAEQEAQAAIEAARKAEWEDDENSAAKAREDAEKAEAEAQKLREQEAELNTASTSVAMVPAAASGVKFTTDFEVTSIDELYAYRVGLVSMEPKRREILEHIQQLTKGDSLPEIPGLRVFRKAVASTR